LSEIIEAMDIYLVRHGEAAASWAEDADPGLSATGQLQAEQVASTLARSVAGNWLLLSSPLRRALETAEPLAQRMGLPVQQHAVFREIPAPVPLPQRQAWLRLFMQQGWGEQGEALLSWRDSAFKHLLNLDRPAVVFTHFLVINAVIGRVLGREETLCFWPDNGSITRLRRTGTRLELIQQGVEMQTAVN
jgi:probable phosphoglycerate mutase